MIVPMKKSSVIILAKDTQNCLIELRRLGVLHIEHHRAPQGKDITIVKDEIILLNDAVGILIQTDPSCPSLVENAEVKADDWRHIARHIIDTHKRIEQAEEYGRNLSIQIDQWKPWGDFDPEEIKNLREKGIFIKLYQVPYKNIKELPKDLAVKTIFTEKGITHCLAVGQKEFSLPFKEISLPHMGLETMHKRLLDNTGALKELDE